jgi:hypothetical protein
MKKENKQNNGGWETRSAITLSKLDGGWEKPACKHNLSLNSQAVMLVAVY